MSDLTTRRLPNFLVIILALAGFGRSLLPYPDLQSALAGLTGMVSGFACWIPFYALRWLGAGDVKMYAAASVWLGPQRAVEGALIAAFAGAVIALAWMLGSRSARNARQSPRTIATMPGLPEPERRPGGLSTIPYGVAMASGALCAYWLPGLLLR